MAAPTRQVFKRRDTITALPLYYSGNLLKKYTGEKEFKKCYGELRGSTIFLYTDETNDTYSEKLDLKTLKSMALDSPYQKQRPTIYTLTFCNEEVHLKVDNADTGEEWRGFIMTVATKEIPSKLQLLPGQMLRLQEVLTEEQMRQNPQRYLPTTLHINPSPGDTYDDSLSGIPSCFLSVSREAAERMLKENPGYGSIILRPSTDKTNYSITLRQDHPSGPLMKNYRVLSTDTGFVIALDDPVDVPSLEAVVNHFMKATEYRLQPYQVPQAYDTRIELPPALPSKTVPRARVAPMIHTQPRTGKKPPSFPIPPPPTKATEASNVYLEADNEYQKAGDVLTPDVRPGNLDEELRTVLQRRREIYKRPTL